MNDYNTRVYILREHILQLINEQQLPISTIYFILKDLYRDAEFTLKEAIEKEKELKKQENNNAANSDDMVMQ